MALLTDELIKPIPAPRDPQEISDGFQEIPGEKKAPGVVEMERLLSVGFSQQQIDDWKEEEANKFRQANFSQQQIDEYFGAKPEPDMSHITEFSQVEIDKIRKENPKPLVLQANQDPKQAEDYLDAFLAGLQMSTGGLMTRQTLPDIDISRDAPMAMEIARAVGVGLGDLPTLFTGGLVGGEFGGGIGAGVSGANPVAAGAGYVVGAGAGAVGLTEFYRKVLIDNYEKGEVTSFKDWYARAAAAVWFGVKGAIVGGATSAVGGAAGATLTPFTKPLVKATGQVAAEIATMTTVGAALEGHVPEPKDFIEAAAVVGAMHGAIHGTSHIARNMRRKYVTSGKLPRVQMEEAAKDSVRLNELLAVENPVIEIDKPKTAAKKKAEKSSAPELTEAEKHIESLIKRDEPRLPRSMEEFKDKMKQVLPAMKAELTSAYINMVNRNQAMVNVVEKLKKESLASENDPGILIQLSGNLGRTEVAIFDGVRQFADPLKYQGRSLSDALKNLKKEDMQPFEWLMFAQQAIDRAAIKPELAKGVDLEMAKEVVKKYGEKYAAESKAVTEYFNNLRAYERDAGLVSEENYKKNIEAFPRYIPSNRYFAPEEMMPGSGFAAVGPRAKKSLVGSKRQYKSLYETMVTETFHRLKNAETNRYMVKLFELAEKNPEVAKDYLTKSELNAKEVSDFINEITTENPKTGEVSTEPVMVTGKKGEVRVIGFRNGVGEVWNIHDKDLANMFKSYEYYEAPRIFQIAAKLSASLKRGVSANPAFPIFNAFRDQFAAMGYSENNLRIFSDTFDAFFKTVIPKTKEYYDWLSLGGGGSGSTQQIMDIMKYDVTKLQKGGFYDAPINLVNPKRYMEVWATFNKTVEESTRVGLFKAALRNGKDPWKAAISGRQDTLDFSQRGASNFMATWARITAYENVAMQSIDKLRVSFQRDPKGFTKRGFIYLTAPSLALWWSQKDDPRYKRASRWEKDGFWLFFPNDWREVNQEEYNSMPYEDLKRNNEGKLEVNYGVTLRLPKPQEIGLLFSSLPVRTAEAIFEKNPRAFDGFGESIVSYSPNVLPNFISPEFQRKTNKDSFGRPLIPAGLEEVSGHLQYNDYTSETGKILGNLISKITPDKPGSYSSPLVIENTLRGWFGWNATAALKASDAALRALGITPDVPKPTDTLKDNPFVASFVSRNPSPGAQPIQDFYKEISKTKQVQVDMKRLLELGRLDEYEALIKQMGADMSDVTKSMSDFRKIISNVTQNPEMTSDEKRRLIDESYYNMIFLAEEGLKAIDEFNAAIKNLEENK